MTRKFAPFVLALFAVAAFAQTPGQTAPSPAAQRSVAPPNKVGIINVQRAIVMSNEGQRDFESLQKKFEPTQAKLRTLNTEIEDLKKQLDTQGPKLNEDARAGLVKQIEQKQKVLQRDYEDAQQDFQQMQNEVVNRIGQKLVAVLDKYAKDNNYAIILDVSNPQSPVLWADANSIDVTEQIIAAYNAQSGVPPPAKPTTTGSTAPAAPSSTRPAPKPAQPAGNPPRNPGL